MTTDQILSLTNTEATPAYIFDLGELEKRISYLRSVLPSEVELCYAVKANSFIIGKAAELVDYLEICSPGEYRICEKLSCPHGKYVISGVNKQADFIEELVSEKHPIAVFTAESKHQFFLLREAAKKQMVLANAADVQESGSEGSGRLTSRLFRTTAIFRSKAWSVTPAPRPVAASGACPVNTDVTAAADVVLPMPISPAATISYPSENRSIAVCMPARMPRAACSLVMAGPSAILRAPSATRRGMTPSGLPREAMPTSMA